MPENFLAILVRSRWLVFLCLVVAMAGGVFYIARATPIYRSTAKLYMQQGPSGLIGQSFIPQRYNLHTQAAVIGSTHILSDAALALEARHVRSFSQVDSPVAELQHNVEVNVGKKDDIISVSFKSPYAKEAAEIVNAIVDAYLDDHAKDRKTTSAEVLAELQSERSELEEELQGKRRELAKMRKDNPVLALALDHGGTVSQELQASIALLNQAKNDSIDARFFAEGIRALAKDPRSLREYVSHQGASNTVGPVDPRMGELDHKLFDLQSQKRQLISLGDLTLDHPQVKAVSAEIEQIGKELRELEEAFAKGVLAAVEQRSRDTKRREEELVKQFEQQRAEALELSDQLTDYQLLMGQIEPASEYLTTIEQKIRETNVNEGLSPMEIRLLEVARPASSPFQPQKARILALALVFGLMMGGFAAVVRDWLDQRIRSTDEIPAILGLPVLGIVPAMARGPESCVRGRKVQLEPSSPEAEAFRTIRTAIFFGASERVAKILLVTSPGAGEGKSTLASNLAIAMAQAGRKTILVDADLRRPVQGATFGTNHQAKSVDAVLSGVVRLRDVIRQTDTPGLSLLATSSHVSNPAEVLNSQRFSRLLRGLAKSFDLVIVDAPPVTVVADAQILGAICDATILVLRMDRSSRRTSQRAITSLQRVGAQLLGAVVNDVPKSGHRYGYYGARCRRDSTARPQDGNGGRPVRSTVSAGQRNQLPVRSEVGR